MHARIILLILLLVSACHNEPVPSNLQPHGKVVPMAHAKTFSVVERDGFRIVDTRAFIVSWGGGSNAPEQSQRLVLVPKGITAPALTGDLAGAQIIRTPVQRIALNTASTEAMMTVLGADDRVVAVGGVKSYNDAIRNRVTSGKIAQIGYGWHSPPNMDALVAAKPEVLLMSMADLSHVQHMERIQALGIPVLAVFIGNEPHYMGRLDYVRLVGMLTGREQQADAYVAMVQSNVDSIKARLVGVEKRKVISAWFAGGDKWMATVRGGDDLLLSDAGGLNLLQQKSDPQQDNYSRISTETMLLNARDADCWIWRDTHSQHIIDKKFLSQFKAYRDGCLFASDGMTKPEVDAFDYYERGPIRPDLELGDIARMLHPDLFQQPFHYVRPDTAKMKKVL